MPIDRPLLVDADGRLLIDSSGQLADPACCCGDSGSCACPEGLADTYCIDIGSDIRFQLNRVGEGCHWCGYDSAAGGEEHRAKFELLLVSYTPIGEDSPQCVWNISIDDHEGDYFKLFDDGDPTGVYDLDAGVGAALSEVFVCEGGEDDFPCEECSEDTPFSEVTIQGEMSGTLPGGSECTVPDTDFAVSVVSDTAVCSDCVGGCATVEIPISYTCPGVCTLQDDPSPRLLFDAALSFDSSTWTMSLSIQTNDMYFCGLDHNALGGDSIYEVDIGADPAGEHVIDFDDPEFPGVHYHIVVNVTL